MIEFSKAKSIKNNLIFRTPSYIVKFATLESINFVWVYKILILTLNVIYVFIHKIESKQENHFCLLSISNVFIV